VYGWTVSGKVGSHESRKSLLSCVEGSERILSLFASLRTLLWDSLFGAGERKPLSDGSGEYLVCTMDLPQGKKRWVIVCTKAREVAAKEQREKT
jgi:hypothetical protein